MGRARTTATAAALASAATLLACAGSEAPRPPAEGRRNFAYTVMDLRDAALNAHDLDTAAGAYAEDAEVIDAATATVVLRGRAAIRAAHARFLASCPSARIEILDRAYGENGRIVADVERVRCRGSAPVETQVRYEIAEGTIVRVLHAGSPAFPR